MRNQTNLLILSVLLYQFTACSYEKPPAPATCNNSSLSLNLDSISDADCGTTNGKASFTASGGVGTLSYQLNDLPPQSTGTFLNLAAGSYTLKVTDGNKCSVSNFFDIKNKNGINITLVPQASGCGTSQGSIQIQASGGQTPYEFKVDNGAFQSSDMFSGLPHGDYTIIGKDANGCQISKTIKITTGISLRNNIKPIVDQKCALSSCHGGSQAPDLRVLNNIIANAGEIKSLTGSRVMPKTGSLTQDQIDLIACWVDDGAPDN